MAEADMECGQTDRLEDIYSTYYDNLLHHPNVDSIFYKKDMGESVSSIPDAYDVVCIWEAWELSSDPTNIQIYVSILVFHNIQNTAFVTQNTSSSCISWNASRLVLIDWIPVLRWTFVKVDYGRCRGKPLDDRCTCGGSSMLARLLQGYAQTASIKCLRNPPFCIKIKVIYWAERSTDKWFLSVLSLQSPFCSLFGQSLQHTACSQLQAGQACLLIIRSDCVCVKHFFTLQRGWLPPPSSLSVNEGRCCCSSTWALPRWIMSTTYGTGKPSFLE